MPEAGDCDSYSLILVEADKDSYLNCYHFPENYQIEAIFLGHLAELWKIIDEYQFKKYSFNCSVKELKLHPNVPSEF